MWYFPFSALTLLVGRQERVKNWVLVCWWWWFDWSFARLLAPVMITLRVKKLKSDGNLYCSDKVCSAVGDVFCRLNKMPLGNWICRPRRRHAARVAQWRRMLCDQRCCRQHLNNTAIVSLFTFASCQHFSTTLTLYFHSLLWHCWLGDRKDIIMSSLLLYSMFLTSFLCVHPSLSSAAHLSAT